MNKELTYKVMRAGVHHYLRLVRIRKLKQKHNK